MKIILFTITLITQFALASEKKSGLVSHLQSGSHGVYAYDLEIHGNFIKFRSSRRCAEDNKECLKNSTLVRIVYPKVLKTEVPRDGSTYLDMGSGYTLSISSGFSIDGKKKFYLESPLEGEERGMELNYDLQVTP